MAETERNVSLTFRMHELVGPFVLFLFRPISLWEKYLMIIYLEFKCRTIGPRMFEKFEII